MLLFVVFLSVLSVFLCVYGMCVFNKVFEYFGMFVSYLSVCVLLFVMCSIVLILFVWIVFMMVWILGFIGVCVMWCCVVKCDSVFWLFV